MPWLGAAFSGQMTRPCDIRGTPQARHKHTTRASAHRYLGLQVIYISNESILAPEESASLAPLPCQIGRLRRDDGLTPPHTRYRYMQLTATNTRRLPYLADGPAIPHRRLKNMDGALNLLRE